MCTYQGYFTICEGVKRFSGSSIWSVICPIIYELIDCKPLASTAAAQAGEHVTALLLEAQVYCSISDVNWCKAGATAAPDLECPNVFPLRIAEAMGQRKWVLLVGVGDGSPAGGWATLPPV